MKRMSVTLVSCALIVGSALAGCAQPVTLSQDEARSWIRHVVPLPKSIDITGKVTVPGSKVAIVSPGDCDPVIEQACKELRETIGLPEDGKAPEKPAFTLTLQLGGAEAESLQALKNSDQAYRISPEAQETGLRLVALTPRGLYYAAKTLQQLIKARAGTGTVEIPLLHVRDWPDLEDRGLWGSDSHVRLKWLADRKMNLVEQISYLGVHDNGRGYARLKGGREPMVKEGPLYGIKPVPSVLHLEQVSKKGVFRVFPNLKAQGGEEGAICYSQPEFVDILADWIVALATLPHVEDVDVWMTENLHQRGGCQCLECQKTDRGVLEVRTILAAWKKAKERIGSVGLRTLTSEETEKSNELIFRELPPEVKVWYYHSLLTYNTGETPLLWRDYLADFAKSGRYLGVTPNLNASVGLAQPFTGADFIHYRMNEIVDKGLSGFTGYATPRVHYCRFNVEAAAEWSWNAKGRSPHEFALSWAVRQGMKDPEKFAEWADTVGPVEWDVYGSEWPSGERRTTPGPVAEALRKGELPELGYVLWDAYRKPFGDIKSLDQLNGDVAAAAKAVRFAREMAIPEFVHESLAAQGYINSLKALWELKHLVGPDGVATGKRDAAARYFEMYVDGLKQAADELPKWEACIKRETDLGQHTQAPVQLIHDMIEQMKEVAADFGFGLD